MDKSKRIKKLQTTGWLYIAPCLAGLILFFLWPFATSLKYALTDKPINGSFAGLNNFRELLSNSTYQTAVKNTLTFMGVCIPLNVALSLGSAILVNGVKKYKKFFTLIFLIPLVIPSGSMAFFWKNLFGNNGFLNNILINLGFGKINWLDSGYSMFVIVLVFIWKNLGYNMVLFLSGLKSIPKDYYEAAYVDGAGKISVFTYITLPSLRNTFVIVLIMSVINSFKVFKEIYLLTGNYPNESIYMLQHYMNNQFNSINYPRLTAASVLLIIALGIPAAVFIKLEGKSKS